MESLFLQQRNRVAIFLSLIRTRLTSPEFQSLLSIQNWADQWFHLGGLSREERTLWLKELESQLNDLYRDLEAGDVARRRLDRLVHLYRDLFRAG